MMRLQLASISIACLLLNFESYALAESADNIIATLNGAVWDTGNTSSVINNNANQFVIPENRQSKYDVAMLLDWVLERQAISAIKTFGITVTDDEIQDAIRREMGDKGEHVNKTNEVLTLLPKALRLARLNPDQSDNIYKKYLINYMPFELWESHLEANYSDKYLTMLENHEPLNIENLDALDAQIRRILQDRKLRDKVAEIAASAESAESAWQQWCAAQILAADVTIYDSELKQNYDSALEALRKFVKH